MMLPEEDRLALKKDGYKITAKGVMPIAHPLQTHNSKSSSSAAQHRQGERDSINNPRPIQPKATPNLRGMSPDGAERWTSGSSPKPKPKPTSTALNTRRYGSADAEERRHAGFNLKPKPTPTSTPIASNTRLHGSADAEERRHAGFNLKPKPTPTSTPIASNTRRYGSADAEERRHASFSLKPKPKPTSTPIASNTRHYGSADAEERRHAGSSLKPKPIPGSAGDLPEARKALQQTSNSYQNLKKLNKGRVFDGELRDLQRETSIAEARVDASEAAKKLQDSPTQARRLNSQNRGITEELRSDRVQQANSAKERYMGTLGLDSSGKPIKLTPPPPPLAPQQSKPEPEKSWWDRARDSVTEKASDAWDKTKSGVNYVKDHAEDFGHAALDVVGLVPVVGDAVDLAHAGWYLAEGDKVNAALSAASAIPFVGDAAKVGKYGAKAVKGAEKLAEASTTVSRATNVANVADKGVE